MAVVSRQARIEMSIVVDIRANINSVPMFGTKAIPKYETSTVLYSSTLPGLSPCVHRPQMTRTPPLPLLPPPRLFILGKELVTFSLVCYVVLFGLGFFSPFPSQLLERVHLPYFDSHLRGASLLSHLVPISWFNFSHPSLDARHAPPNRPDQTKPDSQSVRQHKPTRPISH